MANANQSCPIDSAAISLPKGVYRQQKKLANGSTIYYRDRLTGKRINGEPGTPDFEMSLRAIRATGGISIEDRRRAVGISNALDRLYLTAGRPKTITRAEFDAMVERANGRCEVTGLSFETAKDNPEWLRSPFAPSVDRIDPKGGYVAENCRLVLLAVNVALNQWGDAVFAKIATAYFQRAFALGLVKIEWTK